MLDYNQFINEALGGSAYLKKPTRKDLAVGTMVKTVGRCDNTDLNGQLGIIIKMWDYGKFLIEFLAKFSPNLNAGYNDFGKPGQCYYVPLDNIAEIVPDELAKKIVDKEVVKYHASEDLMKVFRKMKFIPTEEYLDVSFFDLDRNNMEVITYLAAKRFTGDPNAKKGRQSMKAFKILKKLKPALTEAQCNDLVTDYKVAWDKIVNKKEDQIDVVTGEDIRYWYLEDRYGTDDDGNDGDLGSSCMRYDCSQHRFDIYCENPDKCALAIMLDENDKLIARSLVWNLDGGRVYMDRIYAVNDIVKRKMQDWGKDNNMDRYDFNEGPNEKRVTVRRDYGDPDDNPYMDTFCYFNRDKNRLLSSYANREDRNNGDDIVDYTDHD